MSAKLFLTNQIADLRRQLATLKTENKRLRTQLSRVTQTADHVAVMLGDQVYYPNPESGQPWYV
ncbi:MAG: hypothetical protein IMZ69_03630, partial [Spirochaetes bacterium]|nr:hypothetical protein [Spirochaetota bacterium]